MKHRTLSREEKKVWAHVQRSVTPFSGRQIEQIPDEAVPAPEPQKKAAAPPKPPKAKMPVIPPLTLIEPQILKRIRRGGRSDFDGLLDLHGMTQAQAHNALGAFLHAKQMQGARLVIIITGKGAAGPVFDPERERGVLRRMVPHWLRLPDLRSAVLGFETAAAHHGGEGAFYVRLRRNRQSPLA